MVLSKSLETVLAQDYDNLEILVSDNCSTDQTRDLVHSYNDPRLKYVNTGSRVSMASNWEFALTKVVDGWITILGDDDGLMPGCISDVAQIVDEYDVEAVMSNYCFYRWPSYTEKRHGDLRVPLMSGCEIRDAKVWLNKLLDRKTIYSRLPMIYTGGFVNKKVISRIMAKSGRFFNAAPPDVYSAIAISSAIDRYCYCYKPLVLAGISKYSTGSNLFRKDKDQSSLKQFISEKNIPVHSSYDVLGGDWLPPAILGVVYESYMQAKEFFPGITEVDFSRQLNNILASERICSESLKEWAVKFASKHSLNYRLAFLRSRMAAPSIITRGIIRRSVQSLYYEVIDSEDHQLQDVYQAALLADKLIKDRGGRNPVRAILHNYDS